MNRRDLLKGIMLPIVWLGTRSAISASEFESAFSPKIGYMDVDRWFMEQRNENGYKVLLDGRDITDGCVWFDDTTGEAECFKRDSDGHFHLDYAKMRAWGIREPERVFMRGRIEVVR